MNVNNLLQQKLRKVIEMKIFKKKRIIVLSTLFVLLAAGFIYQKASVGIDLKSYKPVGKLYSVGNKMMHIYTGGSGDYTVIFATGWGTANPYVDFYPLYNEVSKHAKFAVYDRFGYGYSDITDNKRDIDTIVDEIHELLNKSGQKPPYILVGHSLASLETIRFAQKYKNEVKGIILVDGGNPEYYANQKPVTFISVFQKQLIRFGIARLLYKIGGFKDSINSERNTLKLLPSELKELDKTSTLIKANNDNIIDEMRRSQSNAKKVVDGGKLENIPLTVITAGNFGQVSQDWLNSQEKLKDWSILGKQLTVKDSKHYIHQYKPKIIVNEILEIAK